jgi:hypothetical protein
MLPALKTPACEPRTAPSASRSPATSASSEPSPASTRQPSRDDPITTPPTASAKTCLRRRNARLPGIICRRLQITADLYAGPGRPVWLAARTEQGVMWCQGVLDYPSHRPMFGCGKPLSAARDRIEDAAGDAATRTSSSAGRWELGERWPSSSLRTLGPRSPRSSRLPRPIADSLRGGEMSDQAAPAAVAPLRLGAFRGLGLRCWSPAPVWPHPAGANLEGVSPVSSRNSGARCAWSAWPYGS